MNIDELLLIPCVFCDVRSYFVTSAFRFNILFTSSCQKLSPTLGSNFVKVGMFCNVVSGLMENLVSQNAVLVVAVPVRHQLVQRMQPQRQFDYQFRFVLTEHLVFVVRI